MMWQRLFGNDETNGDGDVAMESGDALNTYTICF